MKKEGNLLNKLPNKMATKSRDKNIYSQKHLPETRDISYLSALEKRLNQQISARQECCEQLYQMIQHLDSTKKNKIPADFQKLQRIQSPKRHPTFESQDLNLIKVELAEIHSKKQIQDQQHQMKIKEIGRQIKSMKLRLDQIQSIKSNTNILKDELFRFKDEVFQANNYINEQLNNRTQQNFIQGLSQKIQNQYMLMKTFSNEIAKIYNGISTIEGLVKNLGRAVQNLQNVTDNQFGRIQESVAKTSKSVSELKANIEQIVYGIPLKSNQTQFREGMMRGTNDRTLRGQIEMMQKIAYANSRVDGLERRMDLIYEEYLAKPIQHKV